MRADPDPLVIAIYCAACALFPAKRTPRRGRPELISDNELRALMVARAGALAAKKAGLCQLRALLVTCPEPLRGELRSLTRARLLARLAALRPQQHADAELRGTLIALRSLARRVHALAAEERELKHELQARVAQLAPSLLAQPGVGPLAAASSTQARAVRLSPRRRASTNSPRSANRLASGEIDAEAYDALSAKLRAAHAARG